MSIPITKKIIYLGANCDLISYNLYAYCSNNPITYTDPLGTWSWKTVGYIAAGIAVAAITATFVACTGGAVLGVLGVATATIKVAVGTGIAIGTLAGTIEVCNQALESSGEEFDLSEVSQTSGEATIEQMADTLLYNSGTGLGTFFFNHKTTHEISKGVAKLSYSYGKQYVYNSITNTDSDNLIRDVSEDHFGDIMVPIFKCIMEWGVD